MILYLAIAGAGAWLIILLLPWRPWLVSEVLDACPNLPEETLGDITILIPARNEAAVIQKTLRGVKAQGKDMKIILIDDGSKDGTAFAAASVGLEGLRIIPGEPPPEGWSGKLWALEQGIKHVDTPLVLLLDADIELKSGILRTLRNKMQKADVQLVSLMASLRMKGFWEKLLMPAFIYFFKMLYPFRLSNSRFPWVAAAAGGCILVKTAILRESGGFREVHNRIIDDCALAKQVKASGNSIWIGLSHSVCSLRSYGELSTIWEMVARTAFDQLKYSRLLLFLCTATMMIIFIFPVVGLFIPPTLSQVISVTALAAMTLSYVPTLRFYGLSYSWALLLPFIGTLYLAMTWTSAIRFWQGKGAQWKGRAYGSRRASGPSHRSA